MPPLESAIFILNSANGQLQGDVGPIVGLLVPVLAAIMNVILNLVSALSERNSVGITIILATLVIRALMLPQGISSMKSSIKMRAIQPELNKIKKKYGDSKDPEIMRKMNMETQELYRKNKINMFAGCLPMLITLPIFMGFIDLMRRLPIYLTKVRELYVAISEKILEIPGIAEVDSTLYNIAVTKVTPKIATDFLEKNGVPLNTTNAQHLYRFIDTFSPSEWDQIKAEVTNPSVMQSLNDLLVRRDSMQSFLGLNLVETTGWAFPGIIIPILSGGTSFLLSFITQKMTPMPDSGGNMNRMLMMILMPAMMFVFTLSISGGVGVYWIAGNVFAILQQVLLTKFLFKPKSNDGGEILGKAK